MPRHTAVVLSLERFERHFEDIALEVIGDRPAPHRRRWLRRRAGQSGWGIRLHRLKHDQDCDGASDPEEQHRPEEDASRGGEHAVPGAGPGLIRLRRRGLIRGHADHRAATHALEQVAAQALWRFEHFAALSTFAADHLLSRLPSSRFAGRYFPRLSGRKFRTVFEPPSAVS